MLSSTKQEICEQRTKEVSDHLEDLVDLQKVKVVSIVIRGGKADRSSYKPITPTFTHKDTMKIVIR